jgi:hypothetical protein
MWCDGVREMSRAPIGPRIHTNCNVCPKDKVKNGIHDVMTIVPRTKLRP